MAPPHRTLGLVVCTGTAFTSGVNLSMLNVMLSDLARDLPATTSDLQWIISSYTLVYAAGLLPAAAIGDRLGWSTVFRIGLGLTLISGGGAALSANAHQLIAWRAFQGLAAATTQPMSMAIVAQLYPAQHERARAFGFWVAGASLGIASGPVVGGLMLGRFHWSAVFLLNVAVSAVLMGMAWGTLPQTARRRSIPFDCTGLLLAVSGIVALFVALVEAPSAGWLAPTVVCAAAGGSVLIGVFAVWERRAPHPLIDPSEVAARRVWVAIVAFGGIAFTMSGLQMLAGMLARDVLDRSPFSAGLALTPLALGVIVGANLSSRLVSRASTWAVLCCGCGLVVAGALVFVALPPHPPMAALSLGLGLIGLGFGASNPAATTSVLSAFTAERAGIASGLSNASRQVSLALGVGALGSIAASVYRSGVSSAAARSEITGADAVDLQGSLARAIEVSDNLTDVGGEAIRSAARAAFVDGCRVAAATGAVVTGLTMLVTVVCYRPRR